MNSLALRVTSAIVALLLLYGCHFFFGSIGLLYFALGISTIGVGEYYVLTHKNTTLPAKAFIHILLGVFCLVSTVKLPENYLLPIIAISFLISESIVLWTTRNKSKLEEIGLECFQVSLGYLYAIILPSFILVMLNQPRGLPWFGLLLVVTFFGDTFAYFIGLTFGKNRLMPDLSPKKSIEGAIGGVVGAVIGSIVLCHYFLTELPILIVVIWTLITSALCQSGDLFESLLKRLAGKKDSGKIMPGHGGVLDRLDGVYFGAPSTYLLFLLFS